ncbi:MAG: hypothetical protein MJ250_02905 [Alphaproteobacteria bacterium]|nr:hypothetical protein [Alphaproteobacteria bacterium]
MKIEVILGIITAVLIAVGNFLSYKLGKTKGNVDKDKKQEEAVLLANSARNSLRDSSTSERVQQKFSR